MSDLPRGGLTDIKLVDYDAEAAESRVVAALESALNTSISTADPRRLIALALCQSIVQTCVNADYGAKQTLLSYAQGEALDHLGYYMNVNRPQATRATCVATFTRSESSAQQWMPKGVICKGGDLEWETVDAVVFEVGSLTATNVVLACKTAGTIGNGVAIGQVNTIVTPSVVAKTVSNTAPSHGAIDESDDDTYAELIRLGTDSFSVAGPIGAYEYYAKKASTDIISVDVYSPSPANVSIHLLGIGGSAPSTAVVNAVLAACSAETVRPVGDRVTVAAASAVRFKLNATYYIGYKAAANLGESTIKAACEAAYAEYMDWQRTAIGRDILPDKLTQLLLNAGAKRVDITLYEWDDDEDDWVEADADYISVDHDEYAQPSNGALTYGGVEYE